MTSEQLRHIRALHEAINMLLAKYHPGPVLEAHRELEALTSEIERTMKAREIIEQGIPDQQRAEQKSPIRPIQGRLTNFDGAFKPGKIWYSDDEYGGGRSR